MLPTNVNNIELVEVETVEYSSNTYRIIIDDYRIVGMVDGLDATIQALYKILNTERYAYPIYSDQYGLEIYDLIGKDFDFVKSELPRRITEALMYDSRVISVDNFNIERLENTIDNLTASFLVTTTEGSEQMQMGVNLQ